MPNTENLCIICGKRKGMTSAQRNREGLGREFSDQCLPCHTEAGFENQHSDDAHDAVANGADPAEFTGGQATVDSIKKDMETCWICVPALNEAAKDYTPRAGTSRSGMRLTVPVRAAGKTKAEAVKAQLPEGYTATIRTVKGRTTLTAKGAVTLVLHWDAHRGGFSSGTAQATNGTAKRVRNASEALRAAGV